MTEAGKEFVIRAREIIRRTEALEAEMAFYAGLHKGSLTLGIITSLQCNDFGDMLSSFCYNYPDISVNILQDGTHRLAPASERKIDLGFLNRPLTELPSSLDFAKLGEDYYLPLAVPSLHPLAKRGTVSLSELKDEHFIFHQSGQGGIGALPERLPRRRFRTEHRLLSRAAQPPVSIYSGRGWESLSSLPKNSSPVP